MPAVAAAWQRGNIISSAAIMWQWRIVFSNGQLVSVTNRLQPALYVYQYQ